MIIVRTPSQNCRTPESLGIPSPRPISLVVMHATATDGLESPLAWLRDPNSKASAHYIIDKDGIIYQLVDEENVAWHAGVSSWRGMEHIGKSGKPSVNNCSVGIELVNRNDGVDEYPRAQLDPAAMLVSGVCLQHRLPVRAVVSHQDVAPVRKDDPRGFPWQEFLSRLRALGVHE